MMNMRHWLAITGVAAALCLSGSQGYAQQEGGGRGQGPGGPGGFGGGRGFDPAQMQQRMMEYYKTEVLEVTNDDEWKALQPLVQKVMEARMQTMSFGGMGRGMFGGPRRSGGDNADQNRRRGPFGQSSVEADALQKAVEAKAPKAEIKAALEKYVAARKAKQADLEKAQEELRKVLTARQEAQATLNGLL